MLALAAVVLGFAGGFIFAPKGTEVKAVNSSSPTASYESSKTPGIQAAEAATIEALSAKGEITEDWLETINELDTFDQIGVLHARLKDFDPSKFPELMKEMGMFTGSMVDWQVRGMIATRWAQVDPQGMLAFAKQNKGMMSYGLYNTVFAALAKQDPQAAYAAALELDTQRAQQSAMQAVVNTIAETNPQRAIEIAEEYYGNDSSGRGRWLYQSIYRNWAQKDGEAARQSALNLEDGSVKTAALSGAMQEWMANDPGEALAWLDSLPMDSAVYGSRKQVFQNFLNQDFEVAKDYIDSVENPLARRQIMESLQFYNMGWQKSYEEIEEVFDWIGTVATGQVFDSRVSNIIGAMADNDPNRAMDFVLNMRAGNARMNALSAIGGKLAEKDPMLAFAFVDSLPYEDEKRRALGNMSWRLTQQGAESASVMVSDHADPLVQRQLAANISREWSNYDIDAARIWSESLTDDQARKSALRSVLNNWIESDPAATLSYIENSLETNDQSSVLRNAFSSWARNDPQTAVAWLDRLPEEVERKSDIYRDVANNFISHDPMAASEWISELDDSPERDQSVESLVNKISKTDPEASFIWSATVSDENKRKSTLERSVREWAKTDPKAAYQAIVDAQIEAAEKEPLLEMLEGKI